ncbi:hypothetical protein BDZ97DRAFT_1923550 [Flammula alnicola]|nr:hypothetical protein BDZ97DRAFT_1923550 [Flammula alnicola]
MSYSVFDTQSLVVDGTLSTPADPNSTGYRGVRQVPTFSQYDPTAYQVMKKAYLKYIKHIASIEKETAPAANTVTNFTMADLKESVAINQPHKSTFTSATPSDSEDEEDQDELPFKKHRAACSDDDSDEGAQPEVMSVDNDKSTGQDKDNSQDEQSEDTETHQAEGTGLSKSRHPMAAKPPQGHLLVTPRGAQGDHSQDFGFSPTLQGSSPVAPNNRSRPPVRRAPVHRRILLIPEPSNASTPAPEEQPRALRSKTKAEAAAQNAQSKTNAHTGTEGAMKTCSKARGSPSKTRAKKT